MPAPNNRMFHERWRRGARYAYLRLVRSHGDPVHAALGFGLGIFLGVFPTFGIGIPAAVFLASVLRWNKAAAALGALVMNPLTTPFFWSVSATAGAVIFRTDPREIMRAVQNGERLQSVTQGVVIYMIGNFVVSFAFAALGYLVAVRAVRLHRRRKHEAWERRHGMRHGAGS